MPGVPVTITSALGALQHLKYMIAVIMSFIVLTIVVKYSSVYGKNNSIVSNNTTTQTLGIESLLRQIKNLHLQAQQDSNPVVSLVHSSYALGYFQVLINILFKTLTPEQIYKTFQIDTQELQNYLEHDQQRALRDLERQYPGLAVPNIYTLGSGF